jgi:hypothetical protein
MDVGKVQSKGNSRDKVESGQRQSRSKAKAWTEARGVKAQAGAIQKQCREQGRCKCREQGSEQGTEQGRPDEAESKTERGRGKAERKTLSNKVEARAAHTW